MTKTSIGVNRKKENFMEKSKTSKLRTFNIVLQYKKVGKWKDYLYGERAYIILSLVAKTLLAYLVFAGITQP